MHRRRFAPGDTVVFNALGLRALPVKSEAATQEYTVMGYISKGDIVLSYNAGRFTFPERYFEHAFDASAYSDVVFEKLLEGAE